mgnify:CR=1 FL=1
MPKYSEETYLNYQCELVKYQGEYLPHWEVGDGVYFVTFRLCDALPQKKLEAVTKRYHMLMNALRENDDVSSDQLARIGFDFYLDEVDDSLDGGYGRCWLRRPEIADLVSGALEHFDGERYDLYAWCVMPNHVHVAWQKYPDFELGEILHSWKSYTGLKANELLGRAEGSFWQADSYEHLVRTAEELSRICHYILTNPTQAGLDDWRWFGVGGAGGPLNAA